MWSARYHVATGDPLLHPIYGIGRTGCTNETARHGAAAAAATRLPIIVSSYAVELVGTFYVDLGDLESIPIGNAKNCLVQATRRWQT